MVRVTKDIARFFGIDPLLAIAKPIIYLSRRTKWRVSQGKRVKSQGYSPVSFDCYEVHPMLRGQENNVIRDFLMQGQFGDVSVDGRVFRRYDGHGESLDLLPSSQLRS